MEQPQQTPIVEPTILPTSPNASPASKGGKARMQELTPDKRSALGRKAAQARWKKPVVASGATTATPAPAGGAPRRAGRLRKAAYPAARAGHKASVRQKREDRIYGIALMAAEKRLASAIEERACAASTWAVRNAEIPSLQRTIAALRNQQNPAAPVQGYEMTLPDGSLTGYPPNAGPVGYSIDTVLSDAPVPFVRPAPVPAQPQPEIVAPARSLAASRAGGGAIGVNLGDPSDDEDRFLNDSSVADGVWH